VPTSRGSVVRSFFFAGRGESQAFRGAGRYRWRNSGSEGFAGTGHGPTGRAPARTPFRLHMGAIISVFNTRPARRGMLAGGDAHKRVLGTMDFRPRNNFCRSHRRQTARCCLSRSRNVRPRAHKKAILADVGTPHRCLLRPPTSSWVATYARNSTASTTRTGPSGPLQVQGSRREVLFIL